MWNKFCICYTRYYFCVIYTYLVRTSTLLVDEGRKEGLKRWLSRKKSRAQTNRSGEVGGQREREPARRVTCDPESELRRREREERRRQ